MRIFVIMIKINISISLSLICFFYVHVFTVILLPPSSTYSSCPSQPPLPLFPFFILPISFFSSFSYALPLLVPLPPSPICYFNNRSLFTLPRTRPIGRMVPEAWPGGIAAEFSRMCQWQKVSPEYIHVPPFVIRRASEDNVSRVNTPGDPSLSIDRGISPPHTHTHTRSTR